MGVALACWNGGNDTPDACKTRHDNGNHCNHHHHIGRPANWDTFLVPLATSTTASSGSRLLSAFYCRLLADSSDCAFYVDTRGKRLTGPYLDRIELVDNYFAPRRGPTGDRCLVSLRTARAVAPSDDCASTSSTLTSELDYWTASLAPLDPTQRRHGTLPPVLGRSASVGPPADARVKMHRVRTSPQLQDDVHSAYSQSPWSAQFGDCSVLSPQRMAAGAVASAR
ncbi:unnamed protein product [Hyaloperonospora brassicae]|uniref:Uncharacterized protein n=1 Tax=Hyaloperonospora brassicae TaxID=162125 RepID=A0AAV0UBS2_HYABA|nr:unnamed protein product [Hyaloperonospora brassicae]